MKLVVPALLAAGVLCFAPLPAVAEPYHPHCETESRDAQVPSGTYVDVGGRKWAGFKEGGLPPDSLSRSSTVTVCDAVPPPP